MDPLFVRSDVVIPARDLSWSAARASGPGGQNVNKVSSKVELAFDLAGTTAIGDAVKARLRAAYPSYIDAEGRFVVKSQVTRDQPRNLEDARERLRDMIARALVAPKKRKPTRRTWGSQMRRLDEKKRHADKKRERRDRD